MKLQLLCVRCGQINEPEAIVCIRCKESLDVREIDLRKKPGRKPMDPLLKARNPVYVTDWTKSQLDGLVQGKRKTYDQIIRALIHSHRSAAGVARSMAKKLQ